MFLFSFNFHSFLSMIWMNQLTKYLKLVLVLAKVTTNMSHWVEQLNLSNNVQLYYVISCWYLTHLLYQYVCLLIRILNHSKNCFLDWFLFKGNQDTFRVREVLNVRLDKYCRHDSQKLTTILVQKNHTSIGMNSSYCSCFFLWFLLLSQDPICDI